ncbi:hypothetical protein BJY14_002010 [Actinomadura luteofluorescens]|uniref:Uncharacterized protein n=1 Tax=Actinomadura luteofluorescens TaxID=46163 RepID=A0A7Y9JEE4_9ACTN|nr:hypothetical protein [Actinomadura luteofluorescens]
MAVFGPKLRPAASGSPAWHGAGGPPCRAHTLASDRSNLRADARPLRDPATTPMVAIASEGRFERSKNLIAKRAARRAGAMPAIARVSRRWRALRARRRREAQY